MLYKLQFYYCHAIGITSTSNVCAFRETNIMIVVLYFHFTSDIHKSLSISSAAVCPAGQYAAPEMEECAACGANRISSAGAILCEKCKDGTTANSQHTECGKL